MGLSSYNAMNKVISKRIFIKKKIRCPKYFTLVKQGYKKDKLIKLIKKTKIIFPIVAKPINEGSSLGVKICKNISNLNNCAKILFRDYNELIFEPFIGGQEIQVAVLNGVPLGA